MNKFDANNYLNSLLGKKLLYINRSCELVNIGFGEIMCKKNHKGENINFSSYAIHILSPFRITKNDLIILGNADLFIPMHHEQKFVDLNEFNSCMFDSIIYKQQHLFLNEYVKKIFINDFGDLTIVLSNISINVFNVNSSETESWRYFQPHTDYQHLVIYGNKIECI